MEKKVGVILLAGGIGSRMKQDIPKQFTLLNQKPIACFSFEVFADMKEVAEVVVVADPKYHSFFPSCRPKLSFAPPGKRRQDSVQNGLKALSLPSEYVLVHDSARPFIDAPLARRTLKDAYEHGAACASMPLKFTLKMRNSQGLVSKTCDRSLFYEIQTPQVIRRSLIERGFNYAEKNHLEVTDDVSLIENLGLPVYLSEGSYRNIKITTPEDLMIAKSLFST